MTSPQAPPPATAPPTSGAEAFLDLYETAPDRVAILDSKGRVVFANRALRTLIAPADAPLQGVSLFDIVHPHDHAACQAWMQSACRQVAGGRTRLFLLASDGRQIPVETAGTPILEGDHRGGVHAVFTDLTERHKEAESLRESDALLHLLSQHAPCGVFITDAAGRLRYANRRWRTLADLLHVPQPQGVWWQMVHPEDRDRVLTQWQSAQHGTREFTSEFRVNSPGTDVRWVRTRIAHSWTPEGRIATSVGVTEDITLQRQADEVLRQAQEQLEELVHGRTEALQQANRELTDLVYAVTHDLKAPLRGVARLAELLSEDHAERLGDDGRLLIGKLQGRVRKLHALIDGILAYSRVGRGLGPESLVDLNRLVAELSKLLDPPPNFTIRTPEPLPTVSGVPHQLHQIFLNLFDNAIKFLDKPEGRIQVTSRRVGPAWEFSVSDNGPGIPARFHEKIFGLFQRLELLPDRPGTGVGLALVKRIVERRGGQIHVASEEGVGTTFRFTWPDAPPRTVQPL
ncbi:MAG: PAS domain-containing protein [Verrucomicrobiae bacterium]|nr:PAS domain-containing protein [Verrucomicrobiae bacterium]